MTRPASPDERAHEPKREPSREPTRAQRADPAAEALRLHALYRGKIQTMPKCPIRSFDDLAVWYTPGVAAPVRAIAADPEAVYEYTNRGNTIAIVTDGSRVLGLGNVGARASLPVMEGKALLFKYFGGVDAVPICLSTQDAQELIRTVQWLEPSFGGINLEDIAHPRCFRVLAALRSSMRIPVWHDDQQGTAVVVLAGLMNALTVIGKSIDSARIALVGAGAANVAVFHLLLCAGVRAGQIVVCDSGGVLHPGRGDIEREAERCAEKWRICRESNADRVTGGIAEAMRGADAMIAFSRPDPATIKPAWIRSMARDAIVFACANPDPEIWPNDAFAAGARIVATGRSDFANQVNNSLCFPGMFRGVLDVQARTITDNMAIAAARELAAFASQSGLGPERILPRMDEWAVHPRVAVAAGMQAQVDRVARRAISATTLHTTAEQVIFNARASFDVLWERGCMTHA